jgi:hypothetical protein
MTSCIAQGASFTASRIASSSRRRPQFLHQFANRLFPVRNYPQGPNLSVGLGNGDCNRIGMDI